jgi:hypothetical protein
MFLAGVAIAGGIYKWVDDQGRTVYSDTPQPGKAAQPVDIPPQPPKEVLERAQQKLEKLRQERQRGKQLQEVLGSVVLGFAPTVLATMPEPPVSLTVVIKSMAGGSEFKFKITDPSPVWKVEKDKVAASHQDFTFSLKPGSYEIVALEVEAQSLSESRFSLATTGPQFYVPEGNCVHIGRIAFIYTRLPPRSLAQAKAVVGTMAKERGKPIMFLYLKKGALVGASTAVDIPDKAEARQGSASSRHAFERARDRNCAIQLAKF